MTNLIAQLGSGDPLVAGLATATQLTPQLAGGSVNNWMRWINVFSYGAKGTGLVDDTEAIQKAINAGIASDRPIYFPPGTYLVTGFDTINDSIRFIGGGQNTVIKTVSNANIFYVRSGLVSFENITLQGSGKDAGLNNQRGIYFDYVNVGTYHKFNLINVRVIDFAGCGIRFYRTKGNFQAGLIQSIIAEDCNIGIWYSTSGEYVLTTGIYVTGCNIGVLKDAGNCNIIGGYIVSNVLGLQITGTDPNDSHSIINGCTINHNTTNIEIGAITKGEILTGCAIWAGDIYLTDSEGVYFNSCSIDVNNIWMDGTIKCQFNNGYWFGNIPTFQDSNSPDYIINNMTIIGN